MVEKSPLPSDVLVPEPKDEESVAVDEVPTPELRGFSPEEERCMLRKMDWNIVPALAFMYLCNSLDRSNVGNAKTDGWDKDVGLTGDQYFVLVMVFYVPFCLFGTPLSLVVKRFSAARVIPLLMLGYGVMALLTGIAKNFSQIFALRWFLGAFESATLPGIVYYLSTFYKRDELASRIGFFYGLIAFGVFQIKNSAYRGWQYLFWIEGPYLTSITALTGVPPSDFRRLDNCVLHFRIFLAGRFSNSSQSRIGDEITTKPRSPRTARFLTPHEKDIAEARILSDASNAIDEQLSVRHAFGAFKEWQYAVWALICLCFGVPQTSVTNFLPQIVASLGYSTVKTNLFTIAPNIIGTIALIILTTSSDRFRERTIHTCVALAINLVGFIILGLVDAASHRQIAYLACFLLCMGSAAPAVLVSSWYSNNTMSESRRAVVAAVMVGISNSAGLISANVFRAEDAPRYIPALITAACFGGVGIVLVAG
ncbi:MFS transporter [Gloeophyllum trabeum ATCC 11539]|uniref:MFS transporter n=1 Tax=Gloeophyllum trabeum (strain ATCC 11539 / FP-39264 / Madison 617) TaxID=670483 RepID=S7S008_GLOTA|nr:MFS transporter [Gloeophyllum trabeum ATCC 11539]EPQ60670.1 MFS transporter [Gloeophyllum trabeum ATCC 11539]